MASVNYLDLLPADTTISATGGQIIQAVDPRAYRCWVAVNCTTFGTTLTMALQHGPINLAAAMANVLTLATVSATGYTVTHVVTGALYYSLFPFVRINVSANTGTHVLSYCRLYYDLRVY